jgi:putative tricarboxylic transport membrane protein
MAFAAVTLFTILLYVPAFKTAVARARGAAGSGIKALFARRG